MTTRIFATPALAAYFAGKPVQPIGFLPSGRPVFPIAGGADDDPPADPPPSDPPSNDPPADPPPSNDPPKKLDLTQDQLDAILNKRLGEEKAKFEKQLKELQDSAGKTEVEKLTAERDRYKDQAEGAPKTYGPRLAQSEAKLAAMVAKGRPDRLAQIVKQADLADAVGDDGEVDEAKVKAAIEKVLTDFPEWKATPGASGNDLGAGDDGKGKPTFTRKQIEEMSDAERIKRIDELNLAAAEGRITG